MLLTSACLDTEGNNQPSAPSDDRAAAAPDETLAADLPSDSAFAATPESVATCGAICSGVGSAAIKSCGSFGGIAGRVLSGACGFASSVLCTAVCESHSPRSHCSSSSGGHACMNTQYFWWCDSSADGHSVRARYELEDLHNPGIVATPAAPRLSCNTVRFPTAGLVKRWQVCTDGAGCSAWFFPNR